MTEKKNSFLLSKECVNREIGEAHVYHALLFKWNNGLHVLPEFNREVGDLFHFVRDAIETKYILCLSKLFAPSNEAGLWHFIELVKAISDQDIELKAREGRDERATKSRAEFLARYTEYETKIREINKMVNPYRNIQRVHNYPWRVHEGKETWDETQEWIEFAEKIFVQAMDGIYEGSRRVGGFYPTQLDSTIEYFISLMGKGLQDARETKEALMRKARGY